MKITTALMALGAMVALATLSSDAHADVYVKAEIGATVDTQVDAGFASAELNDDLTFGGYVGTAFGPFRVEAGAAHISGDANFFGIPVDASAIDYNATAYLDTASGFYVGAGVNYVQAEATVANVFSVDQEGTGWHVSGGYAFAAAGGIVELQGTYRDIDLDAVDLSGPAFTVGYRRAI